MTDHPTTQSICDKVLHASHEIRADIHPETRVIELTPSSVEIHCLSCKHYLLYGGGTYCVRTPEWTGHTNKYQTKGERI